jgi:hypothetical protein
MLLALREIKLAFRREHGLDLVQVQVDRAHMILRAKIVSLGGGIPRSWLNAA